MKVYKGTVITCDEVNTICKYLVEDNGAIDFVGDSLPDKYNNVIPIELGNRVLMPSFADSHLHFASLALFNSGLNVMNVASNIELVERLVSYLPKSKAKIVIAFGASPHSVKERILLSRADLDRVSVERPIMVVKYDGHACIINTAFLQLLPEKVSQKRGYNSDSGEMNQEAFYAITDYATGTLSTSELVKSMQKNTDYMASKGIGMIHTVSGIGFPKDLDVDLECWVGRGTQGGFQTRLFFQTMDTDKVLKRKLPRIGGCFATALDGCFGSTDAALIEPYEGTTDHGILYYSDEILTDFCKKANRLELQIELHAIGDAAFNQATRALKAALVDYPREDHRHGIIHACLPTEEGLSICAEYGIHIPLQTSFIVWPQEPDWYLKNILGNREALLNPLRSFVDRGIHISAGSDAPCTDPDPMLWIHNACNHPVTDQSLTLQEALRMTTYWGYWASFDEKERGSLEVGKIADMVILSENPYSVPKNKLKDIAICELILSGKLYKKQTQSWIKLLLKGLISKRKI